MPNEFGKYVSYFLTVEMAQSNGTFGGYLFKQDTIEVFFLVYIRYENVVHTGNYTVKHEK